MADPAWAPTSADVAGLLAQRTLTADGEQVGEFDQDTIPTAVQVAALVSITCRDILTACGTIPPPTDEVDLEADAKGVATVGAAAYVEAGFFPTEPDSRLRELRTQYEAMLKRLVTACGQVVNQGTLTPPGTLPDPQYAFPQVAPGTLPAGFQGVRVSSLTERW